MSGSGGSKTDTKQDTSGGLVQVQLTEERVRAIVKEELAAAKPLRKTSKIRPFKSSKRKEIPNE